MKKRDFQDFLYHIYAAFVVLVVFWIYVTTLAPTVSFFDSGELISAAYTLGVAHPPGYPLYVLLGWFFSRLPIGDNVAYRLNLMSAFFAALAALMVYYIIYIIISQRRWKAKGEGRTAKHPEPERMLYPVVSMVAALLFAFSITHWQHALIAEVYSLNAFLCGLIVLLLVKWRYDNAFSLGRESGDNAVDVRNGEDWQSTTIPPTPPLQKGGTTIPPNPPLQKGGKEHVVPAFNEGGKERIPPFFKGGVGGIFLKLPFMSTALAIKEGKKTASPRHTWLLYLVAFIFGLGAGNHQIILLLSFAACFLVLVTTPRILLQVKTLLLIVLFLVLGFSIYLLVPIRAAQNPPINWGNPVSLRQFKWLVTREGYNNVPQGHALKTLWNDLVGNPTQEEPTPDPSQEGNGKGITRVYRVISNSLFLKQLSSFNPLREFGYIGIILALVGMVYSVIVHRVLGFTLLVAILSMVLIVIIVGDPPEENIFLGQEFHTPSYLLVAVWIGIGAMAVVRAVLWVAFENRLFQYGIVFGLALFFLVPPGIQMATTLKTVDRRRNYVAYDYATNILHSLKPNAILFTWGDSGAFPLWYLQIVEKQRPDVTLIHVPHLSTNWYVESLPHDLFVSSDPYHKYVGDLFPMIDEIIQKHWFSRPVYFDYSSSHSLQVPYHLLPHGITYKVAIPGDSLDEDVWDQYHFRGILDDTRIAIDPDIDRTFLMYGSACIELGNYYLDLGQVEKAAHEFNTAVRFDPALGDGIVRMLQFRDKMLGGHVPKAQQNITIVPQSPLK